MVLGGIGGIAPTLSYPRHQKGVSGQHHAPAALYPRGKSPRHPSYRRPGGPVWTWRLQVQSPVAQYIVRHCTHWAAPVHGAVSDYRIFRSITHTKIWEANLRKKYFFSLLKDLRAIRRMGILYTTFQGKTRLMVGKTRYLASSDNTKMNNE
jgi:hypothetical protein